MELLKFLLGIVCISFVAHTTCGLRWGPLQRVRNPFSYNPESNCDHDNHNKFSRDSQRAIVSASIVLASQFVFATATTAEYYDMDPITAAQSQAECSTDTNPSGATTVFCRKLGLVKGRLRGCAANENCYSSSATAAEKYLTPWTYGFTSTTSDGN